VCHEAGDDERARAYLEESLERHRRIFGERHPRTARVLQALGAVTAVRDIERAGELWRQALEIRRATLPADDPDIAASLSTIAGYHYERHELERARDVYREALAVFRKPEDRRHPLNLSIRNDLAAVLGQLGAHDEAEALQREALEIGREVLGPESATVADLVNNLAFTQATARKFREAESSFRDSFEMHRSLFGDDHWRTRNVARNVARALELQERYGEALPWIDRASGTLRGRTEADDGGPELIRAQRAQILFRIGRREEALDEARQAVDSIAHSVDGRAAWRLATARIVLGRILIESGQPHEAESPLAAALVYFAGDRAEPDRRAEASCELARARLLQGGGPDDRRRLHECLPVYRAWAVADRESLAALERLDHS
jgi:tetratricopeptide (TPR) repeat protein